MTEKEKPPVKLGVIGVGRIAVEAHIPCLREAGAEIVALTDVAPGRAARFAAQFGVPGAYDDYHQMLARSDIDAVAVASPTCAHEENAVAALLAGKHVYMEKPPAMNEAQIQRIVDAGRKAGKLLMVGSQSVYQFQAQTLKRLIDAGDMGEIYFVKCTAAGRRDNPHGWYRRKSVAGGDAAIDGMSHILDRVLYLLGTPKPVSVTARTYLKFGSYTPRTPYMDMDFAEGRSTDAPVSDCEDLAAAFIQFANGCTLMVDNARASNVPQPGNMWFYGSKAGACFNPFTIYSETSDGVLTNTTPVAPSEPAGHTLMFKHFLQCIREGRETQSPGERAVILMRIVDAIFKSQETGGREVVLS
jgi:predicted dehydrogenase